MSNVTGIAIVIKAFLPTGKTLDEQFSALSIVKTAHETGDYAPLLAAAQIGEIKTEQKTVRVTAPTTPPPVYDKDCGVSVPGEELTTATGEPVGEIEDVGVIVPNEEPKRRTRAA